MLNLISRVQKNDFFQTKEILSYNKRKPVRNISVDQDLYYLYSIQNYIFG
jgi:hypothetical protein